MIICIFAMCHGDKGHEIEINFFYIFLLLKVYAGDENYEYVPPFSFKLDSNNQLAS